MTSSEIKYLTVLKELQDGGGRARAVDLADRLVCAKPSVTRAMEKLVRRRFVKRTPEREFCLTEQGRELAERYRRELDFLRSMLTDRVGLHPNCARADALAILGAISEECENKLCELLREKYGTVN